MSLLLSFIVPCYNVESYLQICLDSIFACNLPASEYEVLAIDDCSPDRSRSILERNVREHSNLKILTHPFNKGLGGARNTGIDEAQGRFLWFVDSDDVINGEAIKDAVYMADSDNLDVLCFNYHRIDQSGERLSSHLRFGSVGVCDGRSFVDTVFGTDIVKYMGYVWSFLYRVDYLRSRQMTFPLKSYWEDTVFMPRALYEADRVASVPSCYYSYRVNRTSISGVFSSSFPAKMIYDFSIVAGMDLLMFSDTVSDDCYRNVFRDTAIDKYINRFPLLLARTNHSERKRFYSLLKDNEQIVGRLRGVMNRLSRALLIPVLGFGLSELLSFFYKLKHLHRINTTG